jgi:hypothetical protein
MKFFEKLGKVLVENMTYTVVFVVSFIFFLYFAEGDILGGILTALSALIAYISAAELYSAFKKYKAPVAKSEKPAAKKAPAKKIAAKKKK